MGDSVIQQQISAFKSDVDEMPSDTPNKGLWKGLVYVLSAIGTAVDKALEAIQGNGRDGLIKRVDRVEIDVKEILKILKDGRDETLWEWFKNRVAPQLVIQFVNTLVVVIAGLTILHFFELIKLKP